ncbi:glycosyltransferase family 2 protein [Oidiodendron maius Zn]|uniref:chitin synthase n=1 Tax=Oidiodendron maius (strain Zn) TaxID=913774 RepID=A0A0C3GSQ5_OIDMZ|nr:glycosyltransferase family 2 protein [Oidiodendron maius Zn]
MAADEVSPLSADQQPLDHPSSLPRKRGLAQSKQAQMDDYHSNHHYRQHVGNMEVFPPDTGRNPTHGDILARDVDAKSSSSMSSNQGISATPTSQMSPYHARRRAWRDPGIGSTDCKHSPSFWSFYCTVITFWAPGFMLRFFGIPSRAHQEAWREKMGLISIILVSMVIVAFFTLWFSSTVCGETPVRLRVNQVDESFMIFHGSAFDLSQSHHPAALGIPDNSNVLFDLPVKYGGQDGSFLFQNVNGKCKGLITLSEGSDVPTNDDGDLAWYFPCTTFRQDGSGAPNDTELYYPGYGCHTSATARHNFYNLKSSGDVYFTWDDVKNSSRNLVVYSWNVLDLDLLKWFNRSQVTVPPIFADLGNRTTAINAAMRGRDITRAFQSAENKHIAQCFVEIIKVGYIDAETMGCITSKVALYISLVLVLSLVVSKFLLALLFQWFLARKFDISSTSQMLDLKKRNQVIEDWSGNIYRSPQIADVRDKLTGSTKEKRKTDSFLLPTTSRFTSPYTTQRSRIKFNLSHNTMKPQSSDSHPRAPNQHHQTCQSHAAQTPFDIEAYASFNDINSNFDAPRAMSVVSKAVLPQPPINWQPYGFPLAHTICFVTAYSEGERGIRTTLDSIATTDYPNSHKIIMVVCDGLIKGQGETLSTPDIVLGMMKDHTVLPGEVVASSYIAVSAGSKRHNMAKVYSGFYDYGDGSAVLLENQQQVPMMCIVKCGTPDEVYQRKPGNRGKRDSQIILMSFLQKVMFNERMTELEFEIFNGLWNITGQSAESYETVLMVDADTIIYPDSLTYMISAMVKDPAIMGLCGETKIANKKASWVSAIQVFEYFISHHLSKSFESVFGGVTCLPGCFCMYRIKAPKGGPKFWVPILASPDIVEHYSENAVDTLHKKNLLLLGEDRYLSTLMLRTFPKRKQVFVPQAVCKTTVPEKFSVLLSQRRRWINSTVHNLMELVLVPDLCGTFCFSMQFIIFVDLVGTLVLPAAMAFTFYVIIISIIGPVQVMTLILLGFILGLPGVLIVLTAHHSSYVLWMLIYLLSLPIWNFVLPTYAYWKFDDFSWGETRKTHGENAPKEETENDGKFDGSLIIMKRLDEFQKERRV